MGRRSGRSIKKKQEEAAKAAQAAAAEAARPKPFKPGERTELVEQLTSPDDGKLIAAADRLSKAIRDDNPDDFARPLALLLSNSNAWVQAAAAKALVVWATAESEDALDQLVKVNNFMYCRPAIEALATLKTEKAAEAVAAQMPRYRGEAAKALKQMGPIAEAATIALLKNNDFWMRRETIGVLAEIGGRDAMKALLDLAKGLPEHDRTTSARRSTRSSAGWPPCPRARILPPRHDAKKPTGARRQEAVGNRRIGRRSRDAHVARRLGQVRDRSYARQS